MNERPPWVFALTSAGLTRHFEASGLPAFRARQLLKRVYHGNVLDASLMTELPVALRQRLSELVDLSLPVEVGSIATSDGRTIKFALRFRDDEPPVEAVLLYNARRRPTFCISSQLGCSLRCTFCQTSRMGFVRNLSAAELLCQVWYLRRHLPSPRSHNVVFMGMGEPLANRTALGGALAGLHDSATFGISWRNMTVSTAGILEGMQWMTDTFPQVNLALSLNAPTDEIRHTLMPSQPVPIAVLVAAMKSHGRRTGRLPTFEYVIVDGVNSSTSHARELARLIADVPCLVNVIACNPSPDGRHRAPPAVAQTSFLATLRNAGIKATLRRSPGQSIKAGCGQLASNRALVGAGSP